MFGILNVMKAHTTWSGNVRRERLWLPAPEIEFEYYPGQEKKNPEFFSFQWGDIRRRSLPYEGALHYLVEAIVREFRATRRSVRYVIQCGIMDASFLDGDVYPSTAARAAVSAGRIDPPFGYFWNVPGAERGAAEWVEFDPDGLNRRQRGRPTKAERKLTKAEKVRALAMLREGDSLRKTAQVLGVSYMALLYATRAVPRPATIRRAETQFDQAAFSDWLDRVADEWGIDR